MAKVDTLPEIYRPMMGKPSIRWTCCAICGRTYPLNKHHIVRRSAGKMFDEDGREIEKPTITLCGFGNNLKDADGREYCHGLAHHNRLHFRWNEDVNWWEYLITEEPVKYSKALEMEGWRMLWF